MFNPLATDFYDLTDKVLEEKHAELSRKYWMTQNPQVQMQMAIIIEQMREELRTRNARARVQQNQDQDKKGLDNLINIS